MSDAVQVAVISGIVSPILLTVVGGIGWLIKRSLQRIDAQVSNSHKTNLRDDVDVAKNAAAAARVEATAAKTEASAAKNSVKELQENVDRRFDGMKVSQDRQHAEILRILAEQTRRLDAHIDRKG